MAKALADQKMLVGITSPELNERVVYKVLTEGHYRRHVERLRTRLDGVREKTARMLEKTGMKLFIPPSTGMFPVGGRGCRFGRARGGGPRSGFFLLTPGSLFLPHQFSTTCMRFNVANCVDPALPALLAGHLDRAARRSA